MELLNSSLGREILADALIAAAGAAAAALTKTRTAKKTGVAAAMQPRPPTWLRPPPAPSPAS